MGEIIMKRSNSALLIGLVLVLCGYGLLQAGSFGWGGSERIVGSGNVVDSDLPISGIESVSLATQGKMTIEFGPREQLIIRADDNLIDYIDVEVKNGDLRIKKEEGYNLKPKSKIEYFLTVPSLNEVRLLSSGDIIMPDLAVDAFKAELLSSGDLTIGDLNTRSFELRILSSGDVEMGDLKADEFQAHLLSSGDFDVQRIDVPMVEFKLLSSGDVMIRHLDAENMDAVLASSGDLKIDNGNVDSQQIVLQSSGDYRAEKLKSRSANVKVSSGGDAYVNVRDNLVAESYSSGSIYYAGNPKVSLKAHSSGSIKSME